jgi:CarD family transcriptional regulator
MQFKIGDFVVHPTHGVGHIVKLEEKRFFGEDTCLYYEVTVQKSTLWVPVDGRGVTGLRRLTAKRDLDQYRSLLRSRPVALNKDNNKRRLELADRLRQGSFRAMCEVVRDLTARSWHKPLNDADAASLRRAREGLCREWAAAEGVSIADAFQEIDALLLDGKRAHMS